MASPAENNSLIPEIIWPDDLPAAPEFQEEDETPVVPESIEPDDRHWTEILAEQVARVPAFRREATKRQCEDIYSELLPNSDVDWEKDGPVTMCRIIGLPCQGRIFHRIPQLKRHLQTLPHLLHDASLAQLRLAPEQTADRQILLPPPPKKPKLAHTISIEELMGDNLVLEDKPFNEALKLPSSFSYPPWLVIPDSQDSEDEEMTPPPAAEPRLKHTIEKTTGDDLVMKDKSFKEASKMPLSFYYPPWGVVQDSDEDSENEPFVCACYETVRMSME
ncbi:hypothetical protein BKA60DRAFT_624384 [Fusarium oxysporum]|uniref:Uncharacterized protein n=1 Tax=Fusarium oxysporum TaxID=5507 RepID=A0A420NA68_FUSOX|nr:hypothetical protein BKA60DRAFT_624384 [Fusarium oxysporum]RKK77159.1 hypothetical protein BFJ69_g6408 [Fusarium oxysporum]